MRSSTSSVIAIGLALLSLGGAGAAFAAQGAGGGGGGGGGAGGVGGGTGGGTTTTSIGAIRAVSAAATCDGGSSIVVTLDKGFQKRVDTTLIMSTAAAGTWEIHVHDDTNGKAIMGLGTTLPQSPSIRLQSLGSTVPVGVADVSFVAQRREQGNAIGGVDPGFPVLETCTASMVVVAR